MSGYDLWADSDGSMARKAAHEVIKRAGMHVAASMIYGGCDERDRAYSMAHDVESEVGGFIELVRRSIRMLGRDPEQVWVLPAESAEESAPAQKTAPLPPQKAESLRYELARHIAGAYVSGNDDQVRRAKELETSLDRLGLNVDNAVDRQVLEAMRTPPSLRGTGGRADTCPF